jgi:hypothetical protein
MSTTTTTTETNGTTESNGSAITTPRNRVRAVTGTPFLRLYSLASRAERKSFALKRTWEGEGTVSLQVKGALPETLSPEGVTKVMSNHGAVQRGTAGIGASAGSWTAVLVGSSAAQAVKEMVDE